ncbi:MULTISPECIES: DegT/DnrJ/EryC1/StrS family aminotransferase [Halocynthiibacter]|uniref:DegT/DnrJ/EryC1/StrS aminotransferase family protein n=1 Tax=Halocynthiibacter halioticoli TaxID=2986804 RepID=A0AAE3LT50_9RHOB|nr:MULTISPECIES: DegT/DnrJ/EryC1/StrS aminotransferase family protein [Halocynthiibacter]MCV6824501.1 DegT/DnrJ/EryC1/StrS aminotransferase family protein [Halocynthiibacter halioticoli]MCW4057502.1 DegT/DnrJ/EryC1/StrS aminotransferase family protein [Halocynthiibacter sp. SDUM655004]
MQKWPHFSQDEIDAVTEVLASGKVNAWTGPYVKDFENAFAAHFGVNHAIAAMNGSVTLNLALRTLGIQPGDEVIVTPRSFVASASCLLLFGAIPVFADVDPDSQNITPETVAPLITDKTKGIIPVHLAGWPCDMASFMELANEHNLWVIEDCAQAHGARIGDSHVGSFGDFGSFSFCQDKIMTTGGEGGMLVCQDEELWKSAWSYKDHGKNYDTVFNTNHPPGFRWLHENLGTNYRMPGIAAAIGSAQLKKLDDWVAHRTKISMILADATQNLDVLRTPLPTETMTHAFYRFYAFVRPEALATGWSRDRIIKEVSDKGFPIFSGSCSEIYREKMFRDRGFAPKEPLPVARELGETSLAFLVDPTVTEDAANALAECLTAVCTKATA